MRLHDRRRRRHEEDINKHQSPTDANLEGTDLRPPLLQRVQLPPLPLRVTAGELPVVTVPPAPHVDEPPLDGRGDRRPVGPLALLELVRPVQVEQEEGHDVHVTGLRDGGLAPGLEGVEGLGGELAAGLGGVGVVGEGGDGLDLVVEVELEGLVEPVHDGNQLGGVEVFGRREGGEVGGKLDQAFEEGFCGEE